MVECQKTKIVPLLLRNFLILNRKNIYLVLFISLWGKNSIYSITFEGSDQKVSTKGVGGRPLGMTIVNRKMQTFTRC